MSKPEKYVPKHRAPGKHKARRDPWKTLRSTGVITGVAVAATAGVVGVGVLGDDAPPATADLTAADSAATAGYLADRDEAVTRSDRRQSTDPAKAAALSTATATGVVTSHSRQISTEDPRGLARAIMGEFGFADSQFSCLDSLWTRESNWRWNADNPSSSAYGIPQALPGSKMASAGADWETNPETQIRWGLGYIAGRYGTPCAAWGHSESVGWY
ncbi:lytic transglycosylase domain-containing protein [Nocardioides daphniae]|uniref:Lytic transglycosylase domain-containing protein n=1 Tax=Nocardioides daphniae TaxID=402297 RepID=A0A4P7U9E7_9ACTN|nr:lytic transglycosylase domain-containing protein [Nocardioides daphniae]QCC76606.1 lytic transglycosylase domain-containing protein [Nocardioides daphniae]GGD14542.1 hypothetical protein GCM10007231_11910 [Nocardioides daphniae]